MTPALRPADALELSLAGAGNAGVADDLLAVVASLRAAGNAIAPPAGLRARRGALIAGVAPRVTGPQSLTLSRRLQLALIAATLGLVSVVSFAAASAAISWLRDVMPPQPAPYGSPMVDADGTDTPDADAVTPESMPSPSDLNALEQPPGRLLPEDEADDDGETDDDDDDSEAGD